MGRTFQLYNIFYVGWLGEDISKSDTPYFGYKGVHHIPLWHKPKNWFKRFSRMHFSDEASERTSLPVATCNSSDIGDASARIGPLSEDNSDPSCKSLKTNWINDVVSWDSSDVRDQSVNLTQDSDEQALITRDVGTSQGGYGTEYDRKFKARNSVATSQFLSDEFSLEVDESITLGLNQTILSCTSQKQLNKSKTLPNLNAPLCFDDKRKSDRGCGSKLKRLSYIRSENLRPKIRMFEHSWRKTSHPNDEYEKLTGNLVYEQANTTRLRNKKHSIGCEVKASSIAYRITQYLQPFETEAWRSTVYSGPDETKFVCLCLDSSSQCMICSLV